MGPVGRLAAGLGVAASIVVSTGWDRADASGGPQASQVRAALQRAVDAFEARDLAERRVTMADQRGRVVLLDFWATWCAPCLAEIPVIQRARQRYGDRFAVIGVSLDVHDRSTFVAWLRRHQVDWPQVFDGRGWSSPLIVPFGFEAIPFSVLVDPDGRVIGVNVTGDRLERSLSALLGG